MKAVSSEHIIHCIQDIHVKELVKRLNWSVTIRWYYIAFSSLLIVFVYFLAQDHAVSFHFEFLIIANVFLFCCNLLYQYQLRYSYDKCLGTLDLRYYLILQIITDYLALTLVVYTLGSIETPIILMIIPNTILATLFFTPRQSLIIAIFGLLMVISPLILEYFQLIPVISIFNHSLSTSFKNIVLASPTLLSGYIFILFTCVIFCWYLLCSITSRLIKNELELERSYQDMIRLDKEKTHATLRSTHELKAPLAAIKNYVYTMNAGYAGDINDKVLKIINRIGKRCDYLLNNVTDIIKLGNLKSYIVFDAKLEEGPEKEPVNKNYKQFYPINIKQYISEFILNYKTLSHEKNLTIKLNKQFSDKDSKHKNHDYTIMANDENLQLIFINLLTNAVNYSHQNGLIEIDISKKQSNQKQLICVSIRDHGIGIDKQQINNIFEEHFRTNNAAQFYEGGTGLGLSIVKVCSQILNAKIQVESTLNEGTTCTICFNMCKSGDSSHE